MQHREALRVCLSCAQKENVGVCHTAFVVPHFLGRSPHFAVRTCKLNMQKNSNYNSPTRPRRLLPGELQVTIKSKHLQYHNKKKRSQVCCWAALLFAWLCFPLGVFFWCLITFRTVLQSRAAAADRIGFLKFLHHRFLFFFQLCALLHLPPGKYKEAGRQLLQHGWTSVTVG